MECFRPISPYLQFHIMYEHILFSCSICVAFYFDNDEVLYHSRNRGRNRRVFFHRATPSRFAADPQQVRHCNSGYTLHTRNAYVCVCIICLDYTTCHKCLIEFPAVFHHAHTTFQGTSLRTHPLHRYRMGSCAVLFSVWYTKRECECTQQPDSDQRCSFGYAYVVAVGVCSSCKAAFSC